MASKTLMEKIEALPGDKRAEVEDFVEFLAQRKGASASPPAKTFPDEILRQINADREALLREYGLFDTVPFIREFRETGGR